METGSRRPRDHLSGGNAVRNFRCFQDRMKPSSNKLITLVLLALASLALTTQADEKPRSRDQSFDAGWRFLRAVAPGAQTPAFVDSCWRTLDVPHDWSIEDLPVPDSTALDQSATNRVG